MSYATQADLIDRFGEQELIQLTDRAGLGVIDSDVLGRAVADADAEIDAYLSTRMALPLADPPAVLGRLAAVLVRHALYKDAVPDAVQAARDAVISLLRDVANGRASLGPAPAGASDPAGRAQVSTAVKEIDWTTY